MTSNPTIIAKAISGSADYDRQLATLATQGHDAEASYWSPPPAAVVGLDLDQEPRPIPTPSTSTA